MYVLLYTYEESIEQHEAFYRLPFESRNQTYSSITFLMIAAIRAKSRYFTALGLRGRYTMHGDLYS